MSYPATPPASLDALHVRPTALGPSGVAAGDAGIVGAVASIVQLRTAGVGSAPEAAVADTENEWLPSARPVYVTGLVQAVGAAPSIAHAKVAGLIVEWKLNVAEPEVDGFAGPLSITVSAIALAKEYVCTSNVRPSSSVGATVTVVPEIVTFMKWNT